MQCMLCPVGCGADRTLRPGACGVKGLTVAKVGFHLFEEPPICHTNGSGAVFFGGCSLRCVFCQNYAVSRAQRGREVSPARLAEIMRDLEARGADCIDLVTPDHVSMLVAEALSIYRPHIPVVYNSSGYARVEALEAIDPYIDVYLPDFKFRDPFLSCRYTGRADYFEVASKAVAFMAKKPRRYDGKRLLSGILVRHLVLPSCSYDSLGVLDALADILPPGSPLSVMRQYTPMGEYEKYPELGRRVTKREYDRVTDRALQLGFDLFTQEASSASEHYVPDWDDPGF